MDTVVYLNFVISFIFTICYFYQFVYVLVGLFGKSKKYKATKNHRYAAIISARNESGVIGNLVQTLKNQNYPAELIDVFVIADNCTDDTAGVARDAGAIVYERFNKELVGKGYALNWLFEIIKKEHSDKNYDAYMVFDADNVVDPNFVKEMNAVYDNGYRIITSYRNSKNYSENWITAGYSLWFLREARFLNNSRMQLGTSCAVSGTGFLISCDVIEENNGWVHHLLTEDIEFTTDSIIKGEKIGYCEKAVLYDEQPTTFHQSYVQRLRWSKGFYQVFMSYGKGLVKGITKGSFSCYDMLMTVMPAMLLTLLSTVVNIALIPIAILTESSDLPLLVETLVRTLGIFYGVFYFFGLMTTLTEWEQIHCSAKEKIKYTFTFPLFMVTYVPISIVALFKNVKWEPIKHSVSKSISEICDQNNKVNAEK